MFKQSLKYYGKRVEIYITDIPVFQKDNVFLFGNPFNFKEEILTLDNKEFGNSTKGHWLKIDIKAECIQVTNDILGAYRMYYTVNSDDSITLSNDYSYILGQLKIIPSKNELEYQFWEKHGFTTGQATFLTGIQKISPACILEFGSTGIHERPYFKDVFRTPDQEKHKIAIHEDLKDTFEYIKRSSKTVILLFSGGKDSCLLLQYLLNLKISFIPVFFKLNPSNEYGLEDLKKVRRISKQINLEVDEINIDLDNLCDDEINKIIKLQLFDKHYSLLHFMGYKALREKYGNDCLILNGQSSDSILSFGPSEKSLMSYFRRNIMYNSTSLISKLGVFLLGVKTGKKFRLPQNESEKLIALFDEFKYTRVIDCSISAKYLRYIEEYISEKTKNLNSYFSKEMYVKILSFSQGSDNQVVINSAKYNQVNSLMPFATPGIIYNTIRYKDETLEIIQPKYVIEKILTEFFSFNSRVDKTIQVDVSEVAVDFNNSSSKLISENFNYKIEEVLKKNKD